MVEKWLHLNYVPHNQWGYKVAKAIPEAVEKGMFAPAPPEIWELNISINTRIDMLNRVRKRIAQGLTSLYEMIKTHGAEHIFTSEQKGYALNVDEDTKYDLLIDIDAFLFECNACCDLVRNMMMIAHDHIGNPINKDDAGKVIRDILKDAKQDHS